MPRILELEQKAGYESIWSAIRSLKVFTRQDVLCELGKEFGDNVNADTVKSYIQRLVRGGYVEASEFIKTPRGSRMMQYTLSNDVGICAPRLQKDGSQSKNGLIHESLWRSMKMLSTFTVRELMLASTTDMSAPSNDETRDYCNNLTRAGYLRHIDDKYTFIRSKFTGPRPPVVTRTTAVYDANLRQIMYAGPVEVSV